MKGLSQSLDDGELLVILGKSGCGKSTLLKIIAGIISPNQGKIWIDQKDVTSLPPQYRNIGYVPQAQVLFPSMTVLENIKFGLKARKIPKKSFSPRVDKISTLTQIADILDRYPRELSGGQQQRVALARALIVEPAILLLDEPLSSIDRSSREELALMIRRINQETKTSVLYVTHNHEEAQLIADRIAIIDNGTVIQEGTYKALYSHPNSYHVAMIMDKPNIWTIIGSDIDRKTSKYDVQTIFGELSFEEKTITRPSHPTGIFIPPDKIKFTIISSDLFEDSNFNQCLDPSSILNKSSIEFVGVVDSMQIFQNDSYQYLVHFSVGNQVEILKIWTSVSPEVIQIQPNSKVKISISREYSSLL